MADYTLGLTAAEIDATLQGVDDGSLIPAINKIKTSQFVVEGTTGDPIPSTTATNYLSGAEMAFGWVVTTDVVDAILDANGNLTATSGVVEYTFDKADNETPNASSLFASVMRCTDAANSVYAQDYADGSNGISITETATTVTMVIDFSSFAGGKVFGVSEQLGRLPIDSVGEVAQSIGGIGVNQSWQDFTLSRTDGVTYTNTTGRPIKVRVYSDTSSGTQSLQLIVDGSVIDYNLVADSGEAKVVSVGDVIPPDSEYSITLTGTISKWSELR